jgi:hypothetical protein
MAAGDQADVAALQAAHPEWNIVDAKEAPGGGIWAVGADGGVFALNGANFFGSYHSARLAPHRNDPNRRFTGIEVTESGGYRILTDNPAEAGYEFWNENPTPTAPAATSPPAAALPAGGDPALSAEGISARAVLDNLAQTYKLDSAFVERMWQNWLANKDINRVYADMVNDPAYKARFPGMDGLRAQGRVISESEYIDNERSYAGVMQYYGLPSGFYDDPSDFGKFIAGGVSPKEFDERVSMAARATISVPVELREELGRYIDQGDLIAYFLDPPTAEAFVQRSAYFNQATIGAAARTSGFGMLTKEETARLSSLGITEEQAGQRFGEVAEIAPLFEETAGETRAGSELGRTEQVGMVEGSATARTAVERRRQSRRAAFEGGGGAAGGGAGATGLGSAR